VGWTEELLNGFANVLLAALAAVVPEFDGLLNAVDDVLVFRVVADDTAITKRVGLVGSHVQG